MIGALAVSVLLVLGWLIVPPLVSLLLPKQRLDQRDLLAALVGAVTWISLALVWHPVRLFPFWRPTPAVLWIGGISLCAYTALFLLGLRPAEEVEPDGRDDAPANRLTAVVLSPIDEELLFRGILIAVIASAAGTIWAAVWTSLLFASVHLPQRRGGLGRLLRDIAADLSFGFLCAALYLSTSTILAPVLLHVAINAAWSFGDA